MSEEENTQNKPEEQAQEAAVGSSEQQQQAEAGSSSDVQLNGLFGFKVGMSSVYDDKGKMIPVTLVKMEPTVVSQVKTKDKDGYSAVQVAFMPKKAKRTSAAEAGHLKSSGFENGARFKREVRQSLPENIQVGQKVSLASLAKGDKIKITGLSKGRGFAGAMKRWGFGGGPASHGAGFHRKPGSIGNCTYPGRVMPGRKMPGHFGVETITVRNVQVVDVFPEDNVVMLKGPVPGSRNTLVEMTKL